MKLSWVPNFRLLRASPKAIKSAARSPVVGRSISFLQMESAWWLLLLPLLSESASSQLIGGYGGLAVGGYGGFGGIGAQFGGVGGGLGPGC